MLSTYSKNYDLLIEVILIFYKYYRFVIDGYQDWRRLWYVFHREGDIVQNIRNSFEVIEIVDIGVGIWEKILKLSCWLILDLLGSGDA